MTFADLCAEAACVSPGLLAFCSWLEDQDHVLPAYGPLHALAHLADFAHHWPAYLAQRDEWEAQDRRAQLVAVA